MTFRNFHMWKFLKASDNNDVRYSVMARTLDQILDQEKPSVVAEARRKASEMLNAMDQQPIVNAKQDHEADSVDSSPQK